MKKCTLTVLSAIAALSCLTLTAEPIAKTAILGTWFKGDKKRMYIQQFQDDKLSSSRVSAVSKIIERHGCKAFGFDGNEFWDEMKFASKDWAEYLGKGKDYHGTKFEKANFLRCISSGNPETWETWEPMKALSPTPDVNGVWVNKSGLREFTLKSMRDGYCFTTEVETIASRVRGSTISTYVLIEGILKETVIYASEERKARIGKVSVWTVTKENDGLIFKDKRGMTELWSRAPKID